MTDYFQRLISRGVGGKDTISTPTQTRHAPLEELTENEDTSPHDGPLNDRVGYQGLPTIFTPPLGLHDVQAGRKSAGDDEAAMGGREGRHGQRIQPAPILSPSKMKPSESAMIRLAPSGSPQVAIREGREGIKPDDDKHLEDAVSSKGHRLEPERGLPGTDHVIAVVSDGTREMVRITEDEDAMGEGRQGEDPYIARRVAVEGVSNAQGPEVQKQNGGMGRIMTQGLAPGMVDRSVSIDGPVAPDTPHSGIDGQASSVGPILDRRSIEPDVLRSAIEPHVAYVVPSVALNVPVADEDGKETDGRVHVSIGTIEIRAATPSGPGTPSEPTPTGFEDYDRIRRYVARDSY